MSFFCRRKRQNYCKNTAFYRVFVAVAKNRSKFFDKIRFSFDILFTLHYNIIMLKFYNCRFMPAGRDYGLKKQGDNVEKRPQNYMYYTPELDEKQDVFCIF